MTDKQILELDFYDFCGCASVFMTDEDKIKWYREAIENAKEYDKQPKETAMYERYEIQPINSDKEGLNYRIADKHNDDRIATCYLKEHADIVCKALNFYENRYKLNEATA